MWNSLYLHSSVSPGWRSLAGPSHRPTQSVSWAVGRVMARARAGFRVGRCIATLEVGMQTDSDDPYGPACAVVPAAAAAAARPVRGCHCRVFKSARLSAFCWPGATWPASARARPVRMGQAVVRSRATVSDPKSTHTCKRTPSHSPLQPDSVWPTPLPHAAAPPAVRARSLGGPQRAQRLICALRLPPNHGSSSRRRDAMPLAGPWQGAALRPTPLSCPRPAARSARGPRPASARGPPHVRVASGGPPRTSAGDLTLLRISTSPLASSVNSCGSA
jgi:hypothetical protein